MTRIHQPRSLHRPSDRDYDPSVPKAPLGTWGDIWIFPVGYDDAGVANRFEARAMFRDLDGVTRPVAARGKTKSAASNSLREKLITRERMAQSGELKSSDRVSNAVELSLDEATTPRVIVAIEDEVGAASAKTCKSILAGSFALAVRYGALTLNPVREIATLANSRRIPTRALDATERDDWFELLRQDEQAVKADLIDFSKFMIATGERIGECLAVSWRDLDRQGLDEPQRPGYRSMPGPTQREGRDSALTTGVSHARVPSLTPHGESRNAPPNGQLLRYSNGRPITKCRDDYIWERIGRHLPWVATQQISTHWLRHTTPTWVERNRGYATARTFAGHTDTPAAGTTATYVKATLPEIAQALTALTGEPHPLATN